MIPTFRFLLLHEKKVLPWVWFMSWNFPFLHISSLSKTSWYIQHQTLLTKTHLNIRREDHLTLERLGTTKSYHYPRTKRAKQNTYHKPKTSFTWFLNSKLKFCRIASETIDKFICLYSLHSRQTSCVCWSLYNGTAIRVFVAENLESVRIRAYAMVGRTVTCNINLVGEKGWRVRARFLTCRAEIHRAHYLIRTRIVSWRSSACRYTT